MKKSNEIKRRGFRGNEQTKNSSGKAVSAAVPLLLVGSPNTHTDIRYITDFQAPDPMVVLVKGTAVSAVVSELEIGRAKNTMTGCEIYSPSELHLNAQARRQRSAWALALLRKTKTKKIRVNEDFPLRVARELEQAGIRVELQAGAVFSRRAVKRIDEITRIRHAQQAAVIAMRSAVAMLTQSQIGSGGRLIFEKKELTSEAVRAEINRVLLDHGCFCEDVIVAPGLQSADPHQKGTGPIHAHVPVVIDIFPQDLDTGYWGDLTRTVVKGKASPELKRMYKAVRTAQQAAFQQIRPGVGVKRVHQAAADVFIERGYETHLSNGSPEGFIHSTGHGVGLAIHEEPAISNGTRRLRAGNVITIEPGLYYRHLGGIRIEDTVLVTRDKWQYLVPCEKLLELP